MIILDQAATWLQLSEKLMPGGRFMVNCGAGEGEAVSRDNETWKLNAAIRAMCEAFPGQVGLLLVFHLHFFGQLSSNYNCLFYKVNWKKMPKGSGENYMALTGVLPDLSAWSATLPYPLNSSINPWKTCT